MTEDGELRPEFVELLGERINNLNAKEIVFETEREAITRLQRNWDKIVFDNFPELRKISEKRKKYSIDKDPPDYFADSDNNYSIGYDDEFIKDTKKMDNKILQRIEMAIKRICRKPDVIHGDTVKPLSKKLKGLWRYRIGDYRLIYEPDTKNRNIRLICFAARGSVYND